MSQRHLACLHFSEAQAVARGQPLAVFEWESLGMTCVWFL